MENQFADLVRKTVEENWCTKPYCTTCGNLPFRNELSKIAGPGSQDLVRYLERLDIDKYTRLPNWIDCLRIVFILFVPWPDKYRILGSWLLRCRDNVRFADAVLYYIVAGLPLNDEIPSKWIKMCVELATETRDVSLIESLVWCLRQDLGKFPELSDIALGMSRYSSSISTALRKTGHKTTRDVESYRIRIIDNHILANIQGVVALIDTGAPQSLGYGRRFTLLGEQYDLPTAYMGLTVSKLSDYVGSQVNALIGADVLSKTCFAIDWRSHRIDFSDTPLDYEGHTVVMTSFMGIPMVELNVCDTKIRAFLDTGAKISYLNAEITQGRDKGRTVTDFYPGIGRFETPTFRIPIALNDVVFRVVFGNLPRVLEMSLMLAGAQGILGNDIFRYFSVYFDIQRSKITLRRRRKH